MTDIAGASADFQGGRAGVPGLTAFGYSGGENTEKTAAIHAHC